MTDRTELTACSDTPTHAQRKSQRPLLVRVAIVEAGQLVAMVASNGRGLSVKVYGEYTGVYGHTRVNYGAQLVEEEQLLCGCCVFWCLKPVEKPVCA